MLKIFKYSLDKSSKKYKCPSCNKKRFVLYVDNETKQYVSLNNGRCDGLNSCNYNNPVSNNTVLSLPNDYKPKPFDYLPKTYFDESNTLKNNSLANGLLNFIDKKDIIEAFEKYKVGTIDNLISNDPKHNVWLSACIYWYVDLQKRFTYGKVVKYSRNAKRDKTIKMLAHSVQKLVKFKTEDFNKSKQLYGIHLLRNISKETKIAVIEGEKSALIMSILDTNYLWLSTGGLSMLSECRFKCIKDYNITLFPDLSPSDSKVMSFDIWNKFTRELSTKGYKIKCSSYLEKKATTEDKNNKLDLADFALRELATKKDIDYITLKNLNLTKPDAKDLTKLNIENIDNRNISIRVENEIKQLLNNTEDKTQDIIYTSDAISQTAINDLEVFFKDNSLTQPLKINEGTIINPENKTIQSHLKVLKGDSGYRMKLPFYERLLVIKSNIESTNI